MCDSVVACISADLVARLNGHITGYRDGRAQFAESDKGALATLGRAIEEITSAPRYDSGKWGKVFEVTLSHLKPSRPIT